jgi:hypothetical protein
MIFDMLTLLLLLLLLSTPISIFESIEYEPDDDQHTFFEHTCVSLIKDRLKNFPQNVCPNKTLNLSSLPKNNQLFEILTVRQ